MKSAISKAASRATTSEQATKSERDKYRLLVTAGPSYDQSQHQVVHVNTEAPTFIENEFIRAKINVRIRGFRGLPSSSPSVSDYLNDPIHERDQYSVGFSFVPKKNLPSLHTVWGNDLDHPVRDRLPPGINQAFRIVKEFIDPGLACDFYADEPWLYGPSLSCWFAFRIGDKISPDASDFPAPGIFTEGADGSGTSVRESLSLPSNNEKRRKHFLSAQNREAMTFEKDRVYSGDFYNPYLDFANYALKLPGFSLKVIKYIGDKTHCLRYVFKNRKTGEVYFNVNITLLWGEKLERAVREDEEAKAQAQAQAIGGMEREEEGLRRVVVNGEDSGQSSESNDGGQDTGGAQADGSDDEKYESASEGEESQAPGHVATTKRPETMHIHPGDHEAAAKDAATKQKEEPVDEIDRLLRETSTQQKRDDTGTHFDDVD